MTSAPRPADVTIVVPVKDRRELMGRCLDGLMTSAAGASEIIVVDNSSTDGTYELLIERARTSTVPLRVLRADRPSGPARNEGLAAVQTPIVAFVDSDCVPQPGWLDALSSPLGEANVGVVQGRTVPDPDVTEGRWAVTQRVDGLTELYEACNIAYRTEALRRAGGFAEEVGFFCEDTMAGWGVRRLGYAAAFAPGAVVQHTMVHPGIRWFLRRARYYGNLPGAFKRFPEMRPTLLHWGVFVRKSDALLIAAIAGLTAGVRWRPAALAAVPYLWLRRPTGRQPTDLVDAAGAIAFEARILAALASGSLRAHTIVL